MYEIPMPEKTKTTRKETKEILKYFYKKMLPYKGKVLICIGCTILCTLLGVYTPILTAELTNFISQYWILENREIYENLFKCLILISIAWAIPIVLQNLLHLLSTKITLQGTTDIQNEGLQFLFKSSYRFLTDNQLGNISSRIDQLARNFCTFFNAISGHLLEFFITIPVTIVIIFSENWTLWICFLIFWILDIGIHYWFYKKGTKKYEMQAEKQSKQSWYLYDVLTNMLNVLTFSSHTFEYKNRWKYRNERMDSVLDVRKFKVKRNLLLGTLSLIFEIGAVFLTIKLRYTGMVPISTIVLVLMFVGRFNSQLSIVPSLMDDVSQIMGESKKPLEILNTPHEIVDKTEKKLKVWAWKIEFQDLTFGYSKDVKVFEHFDLRIKPWEKIALVGQSGSGKSSLTKLLFRFYDLFDGKITIDDQDISEVTQESLRSQISLVPQEVILFHRSLKENICYGNPKATEEEMISACKMARSYDFISKQERGFDTLVGERGIKLSWWERQRVAIARAILENKKILVLDEATSALDSESEVLIQEAMDEVMKNKTCIVIAHRLSTIRKMDKIIVMEKGKIIEKGSHNELLNLDGTYARLWNLQSDGFLGEE